MKDLEVMQTNEEIRSLENEMLEIKKALHDLIESDQTFRTCVVIFQEIPSNRLMILLTKDGSVRQSIHRPNFDEIQHFCLATGENDVVGNYLRRCEDVGEVYEKESKFFFRDQIELRRRKIEALKEVARRAEYRNPRLVG